MKCPRRVCASVIQRGVTGGRDVSQLALIFADMDSVKPTRTLRFRSFAAAAAAYVQNVQTFQKYTKSCGRQMRPGFLSRVLQVGKKSSDTVRAWRERSTTWWKHGHFHFPFHLCWRNSHQHRTPLRAPPLRDSSNICWLTD